MHGNDETYRAVVAHLIDVGLLSGSEVRRKGGFDGLWGSTLKEVNDKLAQYGGRLSLDELDVEAGAPCMTSSCNRTVACVLPN